MDGDPWMQRLRKSTLVRLMNGLLPLQDGKLSVNGINAGNPANKWELCRICGMVFQNPDNQFVSSVLEEDIALVWKTLRFRNGRSHRK